jgi:hypothetical protein
MAERSRRTAIVVATVLLGIALVGSLVFALVPSVSEDNAGRIVAGVFGAAAMLLAGLLVALVRARSP